MNKQLILINTLNSIGEKYFNDSVYANKDQTKIKTEISSILLNINNLDIQKLNISTRILLEYQFNIDGKTESVIQDLKPYPNKSTEIKDYLSRSNNVIINDIKYLNIFERLAELKRFDLLINNFEWIYKDIMFKTPSISELLLIKEKYPELFSLIVEDHNFFMICFLWYDVYKDSVIEDMILKKINQYHIDYLYLISKNSYTKEQSLINVKLSLERIKLKRNDLEFNYSFKKKIKLWLSYHFTKKFQDNNFETIKI